ncbi:MAG: guanylate kinase [Dehalococcoidales bacterium]|nr:guanylate kinase [Dehalococcoidales bacterium]
MDNTVNHEKSFLPLHRKPSLFILSGPSGVGKDAVLHKLKETSLPLKYVITMTTRPRREKERDNIDYVFVSKEHFQDLIDNDGLLEHANVYGNMYGVPRAQVEEALDKGHDVIVKVDVQGAENIKRIKPDSISIFLMPSSLSELSQRLKQRRTESLEAQELRIKKASEEMEKLPEFDYAVINRRGEIDKAVSEIRSIIIAEICRIRK